MPRPSALTPNGRAILLARTIQVSPSPGTVPSSQTGLSQARRAYLCNQPHPISHPRNTEANHKSRVCKASTETQMSSITRNNTSAGSLTREGVLYDFKGGGYAAAGASPARRHRRVRTLGPTTEGRTCGRGLRPRPRPARRNCGGRSARAGTPREVDIGPGTGHAQDTRGSKTTATDREHQPCRSAGQRRFRALLAAPRRTPDRFDTEEVRGSNPLSPTKKLLVSGLLGTTAL